MKRSIQHYDYYGQHTLIRLDNVSMLSQGKLDLIELSLKVTLLKEVGPEQDFTPLESEFLSECLNVRFKATSGGILCFYSRKPGSGGFGSTQIDAFCRMLKSLEFKRNFNLSLVEDLTVFFQAL